MKLTKEEKNVLKKVIDHYVELGGVFSGNFDSKNGKTSFMYGIETALGALAYEVSYNYGQDFEEKFFQNVAKSLNKNK